MEIAVNKYSVDWIAKKLALLIIWLTTYFSPAAEMLMLVGGLLMLDTYLGVHYAIKRKCFYSRRLESVVHKSVVYIAAIMLAHLAEQSLGVPMLLKITTGYIAYTEAVSVDENIEKVLGFSILKNIIKKIKREREKD